MTRTLSIRNQQDWQAAVRDSAAAVRTAVETGRYQGEVLNFEGPGDFFRHLTPGRWTIITTLQEASAMGVRELARAVGRDVRRVHDDVVALLKLGLLEKTERGALVCPFSDIHVDMHVGRQVA